MERISSLLLNEKLEEAKSVALKHYPFELKELSKRKYSRERMLDVFIKDGFIDRYSGEKLYHPGFLRLMNYLLPDEFPFDPHGKANKCHDIYWDLLPSIDHAISIYRGGKDEIDNYITTSMKRNLAKNNWTIAELGWKLYPAGDIQKWDGQSSNFLLLVEKYKVSQPYINEWYRVTKNKFALPS